MQRRRVPRRHEIEVINDGEKGGLAQVRSFAQCRRILSAEEERGTRLSEV